MPDSDPQSPVGTPTARSAHAEFAEVRLRSDGSDFDLRCGDLLERLRVRLEAAGTAVFAREAHGLLRLCTANLQAPDRLPDAHHELDAVTRLDDCEGFETPAGHHLVSHPIHGAAGPVGALVVAVADARSDDDAVVSATRCDALEAGTSRLAVLLEHRRSQLAARGNRNDAWRLHEAQKLQAMGSMVRGVAHDLNNLLTVVLGQVQLAADAAPEIEGVSSSTTNALDALSLASVISGQLLQVARDRTGDRQTCDWNRVVRRMDRLLATMIGRDHTLHLDLAHDLGPVRADPALLAQVVLNLVLNARDALPAYGTVEISTREVAAGDDRPGRVVFRVRDDGIGMDEAVRARIFEPLFTTKPTGEGTGLGLPTVARIVDSCGGRIRVDSAPGQGTTFEIVLPRAD